MSSVYEHMTNCCAIGEIIRKLLRERLALTSQFDVSKLQKVLQNVIQTHLDQFAEFGPLPLNVCNVVFYLFMYFTCLMYFT